MNDEAFHPGRAMSGTERKVPAKRAYSSMKKTIWKIIVAALCVLLISCNPAVHTDLPSDAESVNEVSNNSEQEKTTLRQADESVVMEATDWRTLRFRDIVPGSLKLTSGPSLTGTMYVEGTDYEFDAESGKIRRLEGSRIPDFTTSLTYKASPKSVDLAVMTTGFHALPFTAFATYTYNAEGNETYVEVMAGINKRNRSAATESLLARIQEGGDFVYAVVGDSISTGAEASDASRQYFNLFASFLKSLNRSLNVTVVNVAVGGEDSRGVEAQIDRLYKELGVVPDLITIAYGMNDQNSLTNVPYISPSQYVDNHKKALARIAQYCENMPEIIVITAMPANPIWNYCSGASELLADELRDWAKSEGMTLSDTGALFASELKHGKNYNELITSNINHPGDYGHKLYFTALQSLFEQE